MRVGPALEITHEFSLEWGQIQGNSEENKTLDQSALIARAVTFSRKIYLCLIRTDLTLFATSRTSKKNSLRSTYYSNSPQDTFRASRAKQ